MGIWWEHGGNRQGIMWMGCFVVDFTGFNEATWWSTESTGDIISVRLSWSPKNSCGFILSLPIHMYIYISMGGFCWVNTEVKFTIFQPTIDYLWFVGTTLLHMGLTHGASWRWHSCISLLLEHAYALLIGFEGLLPHRRRNVLSTLWLHMPQLLRCDPGKELRLHYLWLLGSPGYTADRDTAKRRRTSPSLRQGRGVSLRLRWRSWKATPATSICYMPFIPMKSPLCWLNHNIPMKHTLYPCYINKGHACHV